MRLRQEAESLDGRVLGRIGIGFVLATLFGIALAVSLIQGPHGARAPATPLGVRASETAQYRRIARPSAAPAARLRAYGWVDRDAGIVHVPVERAFELLSAEAANRAAVPAPNGGRGTAPATSALPVRSAP